MNSYNLDFNQTKSKHKGSFNYSNGFVQAKCSCGYKGNQKDNHWEARQELEKHYEKNKEEFFNLNV